MLLLLLQWQWKQQWLRLRAARPRLLGAVGTS